MCERVSHLTSISCFTVFFIVISCFTEFFGLSDPWKLFISRQSLGNYTEPDQFLLIPSHYRNTLSVFYEYFLNEIHRSVVMTSNRHQVTFCRCNHFLKQSLLSECGDLCFEDLHAGRVVEHVLLRNTKNVIAKRVYKRRVMVVGMSAWTGQYLHVAEALMSIITNDVT